MVKLTTTIIAAACAAGFIASAVLNILQFQHAQSDKKLLQGQITDLKYQVNLDHSSPTPTPDASAPAPSDTPAPSATPAPEPSASPAATPAANTKTVKTPGNLHLTADVNSKIVLPYTQLAAGTIVTLGTASGVYQQVTTPSGVTGYIRSDYLK